MNKRYAVLISARNEANVIGNLIDCLHSQTYPSELIDIWLVADNCTDNTAEVARNMGCHVIERFNKGAGRQRLRADLSARPDERVGRIRPV